MEGVAWEERPLPIRRQDTVVFAFIALHVAGHLALAGQYGARLDGYRDGGRPGVHAWLLHAADAYTAGAQASPLVA